MKIYPETMLEKRARVIANYEAQVADFGREQPTNSGKLVCEIHVTHKFFVKEIVQVIVPKLKPDSEGYCCISSYKLEHDAVKDSPTVTLLSAGNDSHVVTS